MHFGFMILKYTRISWYRRVNLHLYNNVKFYNISVLIHDPSVLIEGVLFRARYLGSTQLVCEGQPTKSTRMMQAEEAVSRIKVGNVWHVI